MAVACPHCGQQTVLNAATESTTPDAAAPAGYSDPAPQPRPVAAKPLSPLQQAARAAARVASSPTKPAPSRLAAKLAEKKPAAAPAQETGRDEDSPPAAPPRRCDFCGTKIPADAVACPDCGTVPSAKSEAPSKPNRFRRIGLLIVVVLALAATFRWGAYYLSVRPKRGKDGKAAVEGVELLNHSLQKQPGTALLFVRGSVTNHADVPWYDVKVQCELLDKAGAPLGKFSDIRMVLDPHKLFPFSISVLDPDAVRYTNITVSAQR